MTGWSAASRQGSSPFRELSAVIIVPVLAIYLVVEGRMAFAWLISFAPPSYRQRIDRTAQEVRHVMLAYMRRSVITASICGVYVFVVLSVLRVPFALLLAVMAFLFDFIPVVGTIIMTVPAYAAGITGVAWPGLDGRRSVRAHSSHLGS